MNHITIPGSLTPSIIDIEETSNVGIPGVWIFNFEEGKWMQILSMIVLTYNIIDKESCVLATSHNCTNLKIVFIPSNIQ